MTMTATQSKAPPKMAARSSGPARPAARPTAVRRPARPRRSFRPRLLPATIFAAVLLLGAKVGDVWATLTTGSAFTGATAEAETPLPQGLALQTAATPVQVAEEKGAADHAKPAEPAPAAPGGQPSAGPVPEAKGGQAFTPTELELLQRLQERREQLDQRARELDQREAMLAAAESRFDQKIAELQTLRKEIQGLLVQLNAEQQSQLDSLVKIYETMKPIDAAKIFNDLEMPVLLNVISRMKESKAAPVLAAMSSGRAQEVTILLAERKKLPNVPD